MEQNQLIHNLEDVSCRSFSAIAAISLPIKCLIMLVQAVSPDDQQRQYLPQNFQIDPPNQATHKTSKDLIDRNTVTSVVLEIIFNFDIRKFVHGLLELLDVFSLEVSPQLFVGVAA